MKPSGVDWIGDIPAHWPIQRLRALVDWKNGQWGNEPTGVNDIVCFRKADYTDNAIVGGTTFRHYDGLSFVQKNDILIEKSGGGEKSPVGAVAYVWSEVPAICSNFMARIRPQKVVARYCFYSLLSFYNSSAVIQCIAQTTGIQNLSTSKFLSQAYPYPNVSEQKAIASFLDDRTSAIDRKIQLLEEKATALADMRKSVIHQAVTKGLDPNVAMKPSGVDWIGDIPFGWDVRRMKEICTYVSGDTPDTGKSEFYANDGTGFPWMTIRDLGEKFVMTSKHKISQKGIDSKKMIRQKVGTLMMSFKLSVGVTSIAGVECFTNEAIAAFKGLYTPYWYYAIGPLVTENAKENIYGAPLLNKSLILNAYVVVPPKEQQVTLAKYLDDRTAIIDESIKTITDQVIALKSLRQSLIHEAVTGKIDVADHGYHYA